MNHASSRGSWVAAGLGVCAAVALAHGHSIAFDFVNWDDPLYVIENPAVLTPREVPWWHHLLTPALGYPIPVTMATYQVEHALFGLDPAPFHATNVALHALVALALMAVLHRWGRDEMGPWFSGGIALAFTLHPATVEPVSWVSGRKEILAALFSLLAMASIPRQRFSEAGASGGMQGAGPLSPLPAMGFMLLALLSKPSTLLLPLLFAWLDRDHRRAWTAMLGLGLGLAILSVVLEHEVGALATGRGLDHAVRGIFASAARHAGIILFPFDLAPKYLDPPGGPPLALLLVGCLVIIGTLGTTFVAWRRDHPAWPGLALAVLTYLPSSGVVPLNREYADSYVYLPLAGAMIAMGATLTRLLSATRAAFRASALVASAITLVSFALTSATQAETWRDGVALWGSLYRRYPDSPQVCRNLGNAWMFGRRFEPERAAAVYRHCIETLGNRSFFLKNLAVATFHAGDLDLSQTLFGEVLRDHPTDTTSLKYLKQMEGHRRTSNRTDAYPPETESMERPAWTTGP